MCRTAFFLFLSIAAFSCKTRINVDTVIHHAAIYAADSAGSSFEAMAISEGKIIETGSSKDILSKYAGKEEIDLAGKTIVPGFNDAHAHFLQYGLSLRLTNLYGTKSWDEAVERTRIFAQQFSEQWVVGAGWDQNDWPVKQFPNNKKLDELFPDRPVLLRRVDGHAAIANSAALKIAGISPGQQIAGGIIETRNNQLTGLLVDNAIDLVSAKIPPLTSTQMQDVLLAAQQKCFAAGLTSVTDCGLSRGEIEAIASLQGEGKLLMRINAMIADRDEDIDFYIKKKGISTPYLRVKSVKCYSDGALGSRGACLLHPYSDAPQQSGFLLSAPDHFAKRAAQLKDAGFQMCTHAIGDSANRLILKTYAQVLGGPNDLRWRIEHAQVVDTADFHYFGKYSIIPSVQPTHATSDMYWAGDRLGKERIKSAYAYLRLWNESGWLPLGTDFPVEDINPIATFYSAVFRKDAKGWPKNGFQTENALTRQQALYGMTAGAARAAFEENLKGSLEPGKLADFVVLDRDIMKVSEKEILKTRVVATYSAGKVVFGM